MDDSEKQKLLNGSVESLLNTFPHVPKSTDSNCLKQNPAGLLDALGVGTSTAYHV